MRLINGTPVNSGTPNIKTDNNDADKTFTMIILLCFLNSILLNTVYYDSSYFLIAFLAACIVLRQWMNREINRADIDDRIAARCTWIWLLLTPPLSFIVLLFVFKKFARDKNYKAPDIPLIGLIMVILPLLVYYMVEKWHF